MNSTDDLFNQHFNQIYNSNHYSTLFSGNEIKNQIRNECETELGSLTSLTTRDIKDCILNRLLTHVQTQINTFDELYLNKNLNDDFVAENEYLHQFKTDIDNRCKNNNDNVTDFNNCVDQEQTELLTRFEDIYNDQSGPANFKNTIKRTCMNFNNLSTEQIKSCIKEQIDYNKSINEHVFLDILILENRLLFNLVLTDNQKEEIRNTCSIQTNINNINDMRICIRKQLFQLANVNMIDYYFNEFLNPQTNYPPYVKEKLNNFCNPEEDENKIKQCVRDFLQRYHKITLNTLTYPNFYPLVIFSTTCFIIFLITFIAFSLLYNKTKNKNYSYIRNIFFFITLGFLLFAILGWIDYFDVLNQL